MVSSGKSKDSEICPGSHFVSTHWSIVLAAGRSDKDRARQALEHLCRVYWYPLYAFVRRGGYCAEDARDLTQEYFARLIEKRSFSKVDREKGRFRSFLLASLKHFLANEWDKARAHKRGGGCDIVPLDALSAEERYRLEPADQWSADKIFTRRWAAALLDQVMCRLQNEWNEAGKGKLFHALKETLDGEKSASSYAGIAARFDMTEGAAKVAAHRLRRRYRELLRLEIAQTVALRGQIDEEIRDLFEAFHA